MVARSRFRGLGFAFSVGAGLGALVSLSLGSEAAAFSKGEGRSDPMKLIVSLEKQQIHIYRGTELIKSSRVSTGKKGHSTPAGIFSILQKRRWHRSNIYSNAPMPYMQRLTWSGIALHAGHVPGYPASHGCIRLPRGFASRLFSSTRLGAQVIVTEEETAPRPVAHSTLLQPRPLRLITMDETDALLKWEEDRKGPRRWVPLPARAQEVVPSDVSERSTFGTETTSHQVGNLERTRLSPAQASMQLGDFEHDLGQLEFYSERSTEPLRILITKRQGRKLVRDAQRLLHEAGHDPGPIDGWKGRETRAAIRDFQEAKGLETTGRVSPSLISALYAAVEEAPAPTGHLRVLQGGRKIFEGPVHIAEPEKPLGTHYYSALDFDIWDERARWLAVSPDASENAGALAALDRVKIPQRIRNELERRLVGGSSMIVSDGAVRMELGDGDDFVVLTD